MFESICPAVEYHSNVFVTAACAKRDVFYLLWPLHIFVNSEKIQI